MKHFKNFYLKAKALNVLYVPYSLESARQVTSLHSARPEHARRFRGGLVCKAQRLLYHPTPGLRVIKKKKKACSSSLYNPYSNSPIALTTSLQPLHAPFDPRIAWNGAGQVLSPLRNTHPEHTSRRITHLQPQINLIKSPNKPCKIPNKPCP